MLSALLLLCLALSSSAVADLTHPIDLADSETGLSGGAVIDGSVINLGVGVGDSNGDGSEDFLIGGYRQGQGHYTYGTTSLISGALLRERLDAFTPAVDRDDVALFSIDKLLGAWGGGDVNGDGYADCLATVTPWNSQFMFEPEGRLILGRPSLTRPEFDGTDGFRFASDDPDSYGYHAIAVGPSLGDINGDGLTDFLFEAENEHWLVLGSPTTSESEFVTPEELVQSVISVKLIWSGRPTMQFGSSGVGDFNGDGVDDFLLADDDNWVEEIAFAGTGFLVWGDTSRSASGEMVLADLSSAECLRIVGNRAGHRVGIWSEAAGDVDGDGLNDLLIADENRVYLVWGSDAPLGEDGVLALGEPDGTTFTGFDSSRGLIQRFASAGDVNGDGFSDLIFGAPDHGTEERPFAGESYLVFGSENRADFGAVFDVGDLDGARGVRIDGAKGWGIYGGYIIGDRSGSSVMNGGDINGDGISDLLITASGGAWNEPPDSWDNPYYYYGRGETHVVFGSASTLSATYRSRTMAGDAPRRGVGMVGDNSHWIPHSRCWIDVAGGNGDGPGGSSTETVTVTRSDVGISGLGSENLRDVANVRWEVDTTRPLAGSAEITFHYTDREVAALSSEEHLALYQAPELDGPWAVVPLQFRDSDRNEIGGTVSRGGHFALHTPGQAPHPHVTSLSRMSTTPSASASVEYRIEFSWPVTGVDSSDFELQTLDGLTSPEVIGVTGSGELWTVSIDTGAGSGSLRLDLADDDTIVDGDGVPLGGPGERNGDFKSGDAWVFDRTIPGVVAIERMTAEFIATDTVHYSVEFSEPVSGIDQSDFEVIEDGLTAAGVVSLEVGESTITVEISAGPGDGRLSLMVRDDDSIVDQIGNPIGGFGAGNGDATSEDWCVVDRTPPEIPDPPHTSWPASFVRSPLEWQITPTTDPGTFPSGISEYRIQVGTSPGASDILDEMTDLFESSLVRAETGDIVYARVQAIDGVGNTSAFSESSEGAVFDNEPPTVEITDPPNGSTFLTRVVPIHFVFDDNLSGVNQVIIRHRHESDHFAREIGYGDLDTGEFVFDADEHSASTPLGLHFFYLQGRDGVYNTSLWDKNFPDLVIKITELPPPTAYLEGLLLH